MSERYEAIVVGAAAGGSTCAAPLARRGLRTFLVDKNAIPGGKAMTVGKGGVRYDLCPIVSGPSLNSRFAQVLGEIEMADRMEPLTPEKSIVLMYPSQDSGYNSFVGSAVPEAESSMGALQLMNLGERDLPGVMRLFGDMLQMSPYEIDKLGEVSFAEFVSRYSAPSASALQRGLFYVGCDADRYGRGTHQAADSGVNVAKLVCREHRIRSSAL